MIHSPFKPQTNRSEIQQQWHRTFGFHFVKNPNLKTTQASLNLARLIFLSIVDVSFHQLTEQQTKKPNHAYDRQRKMGKKEREKSAYLLAACNICTIACRVSTLVGKNAAEIELKSVSFYCHPKFEFYSLRTHLFFICAVCCAEPPLLLIDQFYWRCSPLWFIWFIQINCVIWISNTFEVLKISLEILKLWFIIGKTVTAERLQRE